MGYMISPEHFVLPDMLAQQATDIRIRFHQEIFPQNLPPRFSIDDTEAVHNSLHEFVQVSNEGKVD